MPNLGPEPLIDPTAEVTRSTLGAYAEVGARTLMSETRMGDYSYIVQDGEVIHADIGKFCSIARAVRVNPGDHPMERASQSHFTYRSSRYFAGEPDDPEIFERRRSRPVTIGHDVWIGHGAVILSGVSVGTGAVVAAGAVVSKDVAPYTIVAGVAARVIKRRFDEATAERLARLAWWDWDHDQLQAALPDFRALPIRDFLDRYEKKAAA